MTFSHTSYMKLLITLGKPIMHSTSWSCFFCQRAYIFSRVKQIEKKSGESNSPPHTQNGAQSYHNLFISPPFGILDMYTCAPNIFLKPPSPNLNHMVSCMWNLVPLSTRPWDQLLEIRKCSFISAVCQTRQIFYYQVITQHLTFEKDFIIVMYLRNLMS